MSGHFNGGTSQEDERDQYVYTSIRYDRRLVNSEQNTAASCNKPCPFYMLEHHWTRLQVAKWSTFFFTDDRPRPNSGGPAVLLQVLMNAIKKWHEDHPGERPEALRVRLRAFVGGKMSTQINHPLKSVPMSALFPKSFTRSPEGHEKPEWTIVLDVQPTEPGEGTMFKTSDRCAYGRARGAAGIMDYMTPKEVLLYTPSQEILDGSICTPYLFREGCWVTPSSSVGGLQGTTRRWALENGLAVEGAISIDSLVDGETIWLSNAVRGYFCGIFQMREPPREALSEEMVKELDRQRFTYTQSIV
ncbi:hypothetical protein M409DRAFT_19885 [Zasmidium cellare ATCC 36951]|uniref:Aminodeoxychorismate lyase n=1 Tax=Zasmidium cellare ATCC 36951 TaxID=1080233 RepID=A0A6A6CWT0_ZASCE|nr:uncharacterized protein M409DRAFT_19885 [Zasmidium cellare ATCC 36951]KAF2170282.1 hypothetical protein M409DRAFT_19885 [Zasmidium cellare ATCC 36951]